MVVRALVEYGVIGDSDYTYITSFETSFRREANCAFWKERFARYMSSLGIKPSYLKIIKEEYVRD